MSEQEMGRDPTTFEGRFAALLNRYAGASDQPFDATAIATAAAETRRRLRPWMGPVPMFGPSLRAAWVSLLPLGLVATLVGGAIILGAPPARPGPTVTVQPSPPPSPRATPGFRTFTGYGHLGPGLRYVTPSFSFVVPSAGWVADQHVRIFHRRAESGSPVLYLDVGAPFKYEGDACSNPAETPPDGSTPAGLAAGIAGIVDLDDLVITDERVGGHTAKAVAFTVPRAYCRDSNLFLRIYAEHGVKIWIVDVDGSIAWYTAAFPPGTTQNVIQEVEQIIDSIRFEQSVAP